MRSVPRIVGVLLMGLWAVSVAASSGIAPAMSSPPAKVAGAGGNGPYTPPPCVAGVPFADVTCSTFYDAWIEQFARDGITSGCGDGNYCPNDNVTRAQMAVFVEAAMRGTGNWPAHTQLVWAVKASDGSPDPTASGAALLAAVASIPTSGTDAPSYANPWSVKVGAGIFDLGTTPMTLPGYVSMTGAGVDATWVKGETTSGPLVTCNGNQELASLSISNGGTGGQASGVWIAGAVRLSHVVIQAFGASSINSAVVVDASGWSSVFTEAELTAFDGSYSRGLELQNGYVLARGGTMAGSATTGSPQGDGVVVFGGSLEALDSILSGVSYPIVNSAGVAYVAGSRMEGGSVQGTVTCLGLYHASTFYQNTCP
jgi:hypothetical protein